MHSFSLPSGAGFHRQVSPRTLLLLVAAILCFLPDLSRAQESVLEAELLEKENSVETQKGGGAWSAAAAGVKLAVRDQIRTGEFSRATVRMTDRSVARLDEFTTVRIEPPRQVASAGVLDLKKGAAYFFSRERGGEIDVKTPSVNGAIRGTQLIVRVGDSGRTQITVFEGEVDMSNAKGRVQLRSGEQGEAGIGEAPRKTAVIYSRNLLQWALYYPAVLDPDSLGLNAADRRLYGESLEAYRRGNPLRALAALPKGGGGTSGARLFRAGLYLAVGQVPKAEAELRRIGDRGPSNGLRRMIDAVNFVEGRPVDPGSWGAGMGAAELLAESYYAQSRSQLEQALSAAKAATVASPNFGYAWARVAELEFSFGRTSAALRALERSLELAPDNAQAHALQGFLLSAQNKIGDAREAFDRAIALDGALGNAWLGRGLTSIRQGREAEGRRDLQTATVVEPNRALFHSYLAKAFSQAGDNELARKDLARSKEIDPNDPTPYLYSALQNQQENRYNDAVGEMDEALAKNDNRRVYRSGFLLDQDRAVKQSNLAAIYERNGMVDLSVREALKSVNGEYLNAQAHLFLANSYDKLREPRRVLLRYETAWFNETLLASLLSPVGAGPLSQFVSQSEYSKLFESDRTGFTSITDFTGSGEFRETGSVFATYGNVSVALDTDYYYDNGNRENHGISRFESYLSAKIQVTPADTLFLQTKYGALQTGDVRPLYDRSQAIRNFSFNENQEPALALIGWRREWSPSQQTLLLLGRLANEQYYNADGSSVTIIGRNLGPLLIADGAKLSANFSELQTRNGDLPLDSEGSSVRARKAALALAAGMGEIVQAGSALFKTRYRSELQIYSGELQHIARFANHTLVVGGRYQEGDFNVTTEQTVVRGSGGKPSPLEVARFGNPVARIDNSPDFQRLSIYGYDSWKILPWLTLSGGFSYDDIDGPLNFRSVPPSAAETGRSRLSPKIGFFATPCRFFSVWGAYTESLGGVSFDESVRLEPVQFSGFNQAFRTLISESLIGSVSTPVYKNWGIVVEGKLPTRTYWGIDFNIVEQTVDRSNGAYDELFDLNISGSQLAVVPSLLAERIEYREQSVALSLNQLIGRDWSVGARYRYTYADLNQRIQALRAISSLPDSEQGSALHQVDLFALYNHPSGFFGRAEASWFRQDNDNNRDDFARPRNTSEPGDDFWQVNLLAGYRFKRNQCEVSVGILNLLDSDYQLSPLNQTPEFPRERTAFVRCKLAF